MIGIDIARNYIGLEEVRDNKKIRDLLVSQSIHGDISIDPAKTSWCAAWINFCERSVGNPGTGALNAQSFNDYGHPVDDADVKEGDVIVFHFPDDKPWQGHVTYFNGWLRSVEKVSCIGGNQSNKVDVAEYSMHYVTHIRRFR